MVSLFALVALFFFFRASRLWPALRRERLRGSPVSALLGVLVAVFPAACVGWGTVAGAQVGGAKLTASFGERAFAGTAAYYLFLLVLPYLSGIHVQDDVIERDNRAAAISLSAAFLALLPSVIGLQAQYSPLWLLTAAVPPLAWHVLELRTKISWAITIDRDTGTALRLASIVLAMSTLPAYVVLSQLSHPDAPLPSAWAAVAAPILVLIVALFFERRASAPAYPLAPLRSLPACGIYLASGAIATGAAVTFLR